MGIARRKSERRDRSEIGEWQSGYRCVSFSAFSQFTDSVLLHRRLSPRLRRVADMCSSRVTELRIGKRKGRTRSRSVLMRGKILCRSSFSKRSPVSDLRQTKKQRKRDSQGWKPWCPPLCPPPWVRRTTEPSFGSHSCSAGYRCKNLSQKLVIHFIHRTFHRVSGDNLVHKVDNFLYTPSQAAVYLGFSTTHCNIGCGKTTAA